MQQRIPADISHVYGHQEEAIRTIRAGRTTPSGWLSTSPTAGLSLMTYFAEPLKLLAGRVDPPAFNLRKELMLAKHVHATVITHLHQHTRDALGSEQERQAIEETPRTCLVVEVKPVH